jgi:hypothetical protein
MSENGSDNEDKAKKIKLESESETETMMDSEYDELNSENNVIHIIGTSYDGDSNESYILDSDDLEAETSSYDSEDEKIYFGDDQKSEEDSEKSEYAWQDSDENEELRDDYKDTDTWLNNEGLAKNIQKEKKTIAFQINRNIFTAKCRIKLFKCYPHMKVLVDSFNLIYLIKSFEDYKTFKIEYFQISDVVLFDNRLLFCNENSTYIKELSLEGKTTDINKKIGKVKRMLATENYLYTLGDAGISCFDKNLMLKNQFKGQFLDFCATKSGCTVLKSDGNIVQLKEGTMEVLNKLSMDIRYKFKKIYCKENILIVGTDSGLVLLNEQLKEIKQYENLKEEISGLVYNKDFIVHASNCDNSLRIMKASDMTYYDRFPFSKVKILPTTCIEIENDTIYLCSSKFVTALKLSYAK